MPFIRTTSPNEATGALKDLCDGDLAAGGQRARVIEASSLRPDVLAAWNALSTAIASHLDLRLDGRGLDALASPCPTHRLGGGDEEPPFTSEPGGLDAREDCACPTRAQAGTSTETATTASTLPAKAEMNRRAFLCGSLFAALAVPRAAEAQEYQAGKGVPDGWEGTSGPAERAIPPPTAPAAPVATPMHGGPLPRRSAASRSSCSGSMRDDSRVMLSP
jgi:hypothetical protein